MTANFVRSETQFTENIYAAQTAGIQSVISTVLGVNASGSLQEREFGAHLNGIQSREDVSRNNIELRGDYFEESDVLIEVTSHELLRFGTNTSFSYATGLRMKRRFVIVDKTDEGTILISEDQLRTNPRVEAASRARRALSQVALGEVLPYKLDFLIA